MKLENLSADKKDQLANIIFKLDAIKFGIFQLSSGKASPYYVDLRIIPSFPDAYREICEFYAQFITEQVGLKKFDRIAGIPLAGIPFASTIAYNLGKPFLYIRKDIKFHGRERRVEGILISGDHVLLLDDLLTTGLTLKSAAEVVRAEGGVVSDAVVFLDRQEGGREILEKAGVKLHSLLNISDVADTLFELGALDMEGLKTIRKQVIK